MNLNNLNNLIELFANQANKQNKRDIFLEWLNPSNKKTYTWEQTEKNILKNSNKEYLNRDEVNEMIESALRRHNRRSTIISSVLGWILIGGYSFGLFQAVQNV